MFESVLAWPMQTLGMPTPIRIARIVNFEPRASPENLTP